MHDIVSEARRLNILCQGRGSAANSVVCYALGVTEVDPSRGELLMERFISRERNEPPDIDIDFEHERREEVIQYIYRKYGRDRTALTATVISYRPRSALRDMAKVLGLDAVQAERLAGAMQWWDTTVDEDRVREAGFEPGNPQLKLLLDLAGQLLGFPRHLSQHVGGFVISQGLLEELVPIENAAMADRTVIEWDKDDLDELGPAQSGRAGARHAVGAAARRSRCACEFPPQAVHARRHSQGGRARLRNDLARRHHRRVPGGIARADVHVAAPEAQGVLRPRHRGGHRAPGAHPGRHGAPLSTPAAGARARHLSERSGEGRARRARSGVPIFQEQVMQLAIVAAGFTPGEADQLRRSMAAWKRRGGLGHFEQRLIEGMSARGYDESFARQIFSQIQGFGEYGFPESHAASFALLVYSSAWLKCHEPAAFTCALINSQPMGFYAPAQLVRDARDHGVEVAARRCVCISGWDCTLERRADDEPALRLGLRMVKGLGEAAAERIVSRACGTGVRERAGSRTAREARAP